MASVTRTITTGVDDYDDSSSTNTTIQAVQYPPASLNRSAYFVLDTSITGTITGATVHWYDSAFSIIGPVLYQGSMDIGGTVIYSFSSTKAPSTGWKSHALSSGELSLLNSAGDTTFRLTVPNPGGSNLVSWAIRAYEYSTPGGVYSAYIVIDYDLPVAERRQRIFIL